MLERIRIYLKNEAEYEDSLTDTFEEIANLNELVINELEVEELDFDDY